MEPIGIGTLAKVLPAIIGLFKKHVVDRWSNARANAFLKQFLESIGKSNSIGPDEAALLQKLMEDEHRSETLFQAYRKVVLSASKTIGPKILAILAARAITRGEGHTTDPEERMMMAAERLSDVELEEFAKFVKNNGNELVASRERELSGPFGNEYTMSGIDLGEFLGNWAIKMQQCGMLMVEITKKSEVSMFRMAGIGDAPDGMEHTYTCYIKLTYECTELSSLVLELVSSDSNK